VATYYEILNVTRDAPSSAITNAYGKLAVELHPDKNQDNPGEAKKKYKLVREAYNVLSDPEQRAIYNALLPSNDGAYEPGKIRYVEYRPFIVLLAQQTGLNEQYIHDLFYSDRARFDNLNKLHDYLGKCALTSEGKLHQIETLQEILNASQEEALNLFAAHRFVEAELMTIQDAKALTKEERAILSKINPSDPNDLLEKMYQLQTHRAEHSPRMANL
jgi:curved DNA-binding protein CbpA